MSQNDPLNKELWIRESPQDLRSLYRNNSIPEAILAYLSSSKFRKSPLGPILRESMASYIEHSISCGNPLKLFNLIGGYKQAALRNSPLPDWAELFNLAFLYRIGHQLNSNYPHGITIIYRSDEIVMTALGNYKSLHRKAYSITFGQMINYVNKLSSDTKLEFHLEYTCSTSRPNDLFSLMFEMYKSCRHEFYRLPKAIQEKKVAVSMRNQCWNGEKDLAHFSLTDKIAWSRRCAILHEAFLRADIELSGEYLRDGISISYRRGVPGAMHYRSCNSSSVQPWAGEGCLIMKDGTYHPWILSKEQLGRINTSILTNNLRTPLELESLRDIRYASYNNEI